MPGVAIVSGSVRTVTLVLVTFARSGCDRVLRRRLFAGYRRAMLVMMPVMPLVMSGIASRHWLMSSGLACLTSA
jgi:hypothetical protein